ncbi:MAG: hypothetical protein ABWY93_02875 [Mycobacterium sp.]
MSDLNPAIEYGGGDNTYASMIPIDRYVATKYLGAAYTILITDKDLNVVGDPLEHWTSLQATVRWKEPGSGQIVTPAHKYVREQIQPGNRVVIIRRVFGLSDTLISGPIEEVLRERSDDGENGGVGVMTITFADDMSWLGARVTYPQPGKEPKDQTADYWEYTGSPVTAMVNLVNLNAGPAALTARRVPQLLVGAETAIAGVKSVKVKTRFEKVTDVLRRIATQGNGDSFDPDSLGFTCKQVNQDILFTVVRSRDLRGQVIFSFNVGNLQYYAFDLVAPEITHPIVGGQGSNLDGEVSGSARFVDLFPTTNTANLAWGRYESFEPMDGSQGNAALAAQAVTVLAEHGESARLASNASDTPDQRFGVHYTVGDLVSLELQTGQFVSGLVQTINVQAYPTAGEVVGVTIGNQAARYDSAYVRQLRTLNRRVGDLERTSTPSRP